MFCMEVMEHFAPSTKRGISTSGAYHVIFGYQLLIETDIIVVQEICIHRNILRMYMYMNCTYSVGVVEYSMTEYWLNIDYSNDARLVALCFDLVPFPFAFSYETHNSFDGVGTCWYSSRTVDIVLTI